MVPRYDVCILGAGPAGFAAAVRAHDLGKTVALVEPRRLGGAGIHDGALSSKTLWHLALDYARACRSDRGYAGAGLGLTWADVRAQASAACAEAEAHVARQLAAMARPSSRGGRVDRVVGRGRFVAPQRIEVTGDSPTLIEADRFLIATGSRPRGLPGVVVDGERIVTSDQIEHVAALPASLAVVGAGVVGCEYATIFASFGATAVELLDRQPRILPFEDEDVAASVTASFTAMGIHVHREARLEEVRLDHDGVALAIRCGADVIQRRVERVLLAVGRTPATEDLGLEVAGVALAGNGSILVEGTRTRAAHVWAAGDTTADVMLANMAEIEGRHAVEDMFGLAPPPIHYEAQSAIYFFRPEVASVGLNEQMARAAGIPYRAAIVSAQLVRRTIAMRATDGFIKLLAHPDGRILGLRVVGPQAGSCIQGVALLIASGGTLTDLDRCVHPHPAVTEGVQEAARLLLGRSLYEPASSDRLCRIVDHLA